MLSLSRYQLKIYFLFILISFSGCDHICTEIEEELLVSQSRILQDGEDWETITNRAERSFYINRPIRVQLTEGNSIEVTSYLPTKTSNVEIWAESVGFPEPLRMLKLSQLESFSQNVYLLPTTHSDGFLIGKSGKKHFLRRRAKYNEGDLEFSVTTSDSLYQQIAALDVNWFIYFGRYDSPGKWKRINALYAREWIIMMTNLAAVTCSEELSVLLLDHYKESNGRNVEFHRNNGTFFSTKKEYEDLLESIKRKPSFSLGVTSMGGGLGGGQTLGIDTWNFYSHYYGGTSILVHEFGHTIGYGHSSSFCYGEYQYYMTDVWAMLIRLGKLPYLSDDINGFYRPENAMYRDGDVNQNMRKPRPNGSFNAPERFLLENPSVLPKTAARLETFR